MAERALLVWPNVVTYIKAVRIGKIKEPQIKSFKTLESFTKDKLLLPKVSFLFN